MDCNKVLQSQPWFRETKFIVFKNGKRTLIQSKKDFNQCFYGYVYLDFLWKCGMIVFIDISIVPLVS